MDKAVGHLPFGKLGEGHYGMNLGQLHRKYAILLDNDFFFELVRNVPFIERSSTFNIADYGSADGAATMVLMKTLLDFVRTIHGDSVQIQVIHEDQACNDFNSLFRRLAGGISQPPSYLCGQKNVYAFASGTTFYQQCVSDESLHVIMCMAAVHWLSSRPPKSTDAIYCFPGTDMESEVKLQAAHDWDVFLLHRSRELKVGGLLVVSAPSDNPDVGVCNENILKILTSTWKQFQQSGRITEDEFVNTNIACFHKSIKMLRAPFEDVESAVYKSGLKLLKSELINIQCNCYTAWKEQYELDGTDDRETYARNLTSAHRCWTNSAFLDGLSESRPQDERERIVEDFYEQVAQVVASMNPQEFNSDYYFSFLFITRV